MDILITVFLRNHTDARLRTGLQVHSTGLCKLLVSLLSVVQADRQNLTCLYAYAGFQLPREPFELMNRYNTRERDIEVTTIAFQR